MADAGFILCEISHNACTMLAHSLPNIVPALGERFVFDVFVSVLDLQTKHTYNMIIKEPTLHNSTQYIYKSRATYFHLSVQSIESHFLWSTSWLSALVINRYKSFETRQYYASIVPCNIHILISIAFTKRVEEFLKITGLVLLIINKIKNLGI